MRTRLKKKPEPVQLTDALQDRIVMQEDEVIRRYRERINSPLTAIRAHCVECMGGSVHEVARCTSKDCSLHLLRMGINEYDARRVKKRKDKDDV
jgi:hypothetical protein